MTICVQGVLWGDEGAVSGHGVMLKRGKSAARGRGALSLWIFLQGPGHIFKTPIKKPHLILKKVL